MFIAKNKTKNSFKVIDDIGAIDQTLFQTHDLFQAQPITPQQFTEVLRQKKINDLKNELAALGVDLSAQQQATVATEDTELPESAVAGPATDTVVQPMVPNNPVLHNTVADQKEDPAGVERQVMSKVVNKKTGQPFSMDELRDHFEKFQTLIEKDVPEVQYTVFNDDGFVLVTSQPLPNVPRVLPNGIPIRQQVG